MSAKKLSESDINPICRAVALGEPMLSVARRMGAA